MILFLDLQFGGMWLYQPQKKTTTPGAAISA